MVNVVLSTSKSKIVNVPSSIVILPPSAERTISLAASNVMSAVIPLVSMISPLPAVTPDPDISKALLLFLNAPIKTPPSLNRISAPSASRIMSAAESNVMSAAMPLVIIMSALVPSELGEEPDNSKAALLFLIAPIKTPPSLNRRSFPWASKIISPAESSVIVVASTSKVPSAVI